MLRSCYWLVAACTAALVGCGGATPTGPSANPIPRLSRTKFLAFGDSLTSGEVTAPVSAADRVGKLVVVPSASYPAVLQSQLQSSYPGQAPDIIVSNQGKSGETIFDGALRFDEVFESSRAQAVIIQEGVNGLSAAGVDATTTLIRQMVQRAKNGSARVFVASMVPTLPNRQRSQNAALLVAYNDALRAMCTLEGVTFVDLYNALLPQAEQLIGIDGLHPNEAGYRRIAELFFSAIQRELQE